MTAAGESQQGRPDVRFERRPNEGPTSAVPIVPAIGTDESKSRNRAPRRITPEFGEQLRTWRERRGWTRQDVARAAGITAGYLGHLERALAAPSVIVADALGFALDLTAEEVAPLQAQAVTDAGRAHPLRLEREARRRPPRRAQTREQMRDALLAAIARDLTEYDRGL